MKASQIPRKPNVSFIIATFNCVERIATLRRTVEALAAHHVEFLVSDGGSTDGTLEALRAVSGLRVISSAPDRGIYEAWNRALPHVTGIYVAFIGPDDEPGADFLSECEALIKHSSQLPALIFGDALKTLYSRSRRVSPPARPRLVFGAIPVFDVCHPGMLHSAVLFAQTGFDEGFRLAGDLHFLLKKRDEIRAAGVVKLGSLQAIIDAAGISNSATAFRLYSSEYRRIESELGLTIAYSKTKLELLSWFERMPRLFEQIRKLSWRFRGSEMHGPPNAASTRESL